jgi:uncharacterized protein (DUF983 family)
MISRNAPRPNAANESAKPGPDVWTAVLRGLRFRCPNCGRGRLFRAYLKPVESCAQCGENLGRIRADDGPAWLTVLITGHVTVGTALTTEIVHPLPVAVSLALFTSLTLVMALALLPRAKGVFIGAIWAMNATGEE